MGYPIRTGMNTCSNGHYGGDWTMGFGVCSGFGIGKTACMPNIPQATGAGYLTSPGATPGEAPLGFTAKMLPVPNSVKEILTESAKKSSSKSAKGEYGKEAK